MLEAKDGTIRCEYDYYDTMAMLTQLNVTQPDSQAHLLGD